MIIISYDSIFFNNPIFVKTIIMKKTVILLLFAFFYQTYQAQEWYDDQCDIETKIDLKTYKKENVRNILTIIIDQENTLILNDKPYPQMSEVKFKEYILDFITNPENKKTSAESPKSAIIAISSFGEKNNMQMIENYVREVYLYLWNQKAVQEYDKQWPNLNCKKREKIVKKYFPYNLYKIENESDTSKKKENMFLSTPTFKGDVNDN